MKGLMTAVLLLSGSAAATACPDFAGYTPLPFKVNGTQSECPITRRDVLDEWFKVPLASGLPSEELKGFYGYEVKILRPVVDQPGNWCFAQILTKKSMDGDAGPTVNIYVRMLQRSATTPGLNFIMQFCQVEDRA